MVGQSSATSTTKSRMTAEPAPLILVVDDDADIREALAGLFRSIGNRIVSFESAQHLLAAGIPAEANCMILDVRLPGTSGLDLQDMLTRLDVRIPVILMTGYGDVPMTVRGMKAGALDFLTKPFREQEMLDAVAAAVNLDRRQREAARKRNEVVQRFARLTPREKQIFEMVSAGSLNKNVAADLGLSEITVKIHRGRVMKKMAARSIADLVRMAELIAPRSGEAM
jgi:FixJ family two-component response regulator